MKRIETLVREAGRGSLTKGQMTLPTSYSLVVQQEFVRVSTYGKGAGEAPGLYRMDCTFDCGPESEADFSSGEEVVLRLKDGRGPVEMQVLSEVFGTSGRLQPTRAGKSQLKVLFRLS